MCSQGGRRRAGSEQAGNRSSVSCASSRPNAEWSPFSAAGTVPPAPHRRFPPGGPIFLGRGLRLPRPMPRPRCGVVPRLVRPRLPVRSATSRKIAAIRWSAKLNPIHARCPSSSRASTCGSLPAYARRYSVVASTTESGRLCWPCAKVPATLPHQTPRHRSAIGLALAHRPREQPVADTPAAPAFVHRQFLGHGWSSPRL